LVFGAVDRQIEINGSSAPGVRSKRMPRRVIVRPGGRHPARKPMRLNLASVAALLKMTAER
jgi:hypothetical protein